MGRKRRDNESRGSARGRDGRGHRVRDNASRNNENVRVIRNPLDVERENVRILSDSFNSSELSYSGSDKIVFIPNEDEIQSIWEGFWKKGLANQHQMRRFLNSCLVITSKDEYEVGELVTNLSEPDGRQRLREIVMFPVSVDAGLQPHVASFQRVTLPFLALLTRSGITDSILETQINAIYTLVYSNLDNFIHDKVMTMLETLVQRNSLADQRTPQDDLLRDDSNSFIPTSLGQFFLVIVKLCNVFLDRIKEASSNETMSKITQRLENAMKIWKNSLITQQRNKEFKKVKQMIKNSVRILNEDNSNNTTDASTSVYRERAQIVNLNRFYDPPGELSNYGPRHDNDFSDISKISIIPTKDEILSVRSPFLPTNIPEAPHFLPEGAARLFDSQFRLLREDMLNPIREGIKSFLQFLAISKRNDLELRRYKEMGGRYKYESGQDNGDLYIYANARFVGITVDRRRGFSCRIAFTGPKNIGRSREERKFYWQRSKKLMSGNLVCLLWPTGDTVSVNSNNIPNTTTQYSLFFGVIVQKEEEQLAKYEDIVEIDINFTDASVYPLALKDISSQKNRNMEQNMSSRFMVEFTGVYLESYYHILKTLQSTNKSTLPFERYLTMAGIDGENPKNASVVDVPDYARAPGFHFNLSVLLRDKQRQLLLNVANINEHKNVIKELTNGSMLDDTQAEALVSSLCKEIALIEGPPGTGKTVIGVEIMKVLLAPENRNIKLGPILTICFTNHALDQFLEHLIDKAGISNIVRLGGRSKSNKIAPFNLEEIVRNWANPGKSLTKAYKSLETIQQQADKNQRILNQRWLGWNDVSPYLIVEFEGHYNKFSKYRDDPEAPSFLLCNDWDDDEYVGDNYVNKKVFEWWLRGTDIKNAKSMIQTMENQRNGKRKRKGNSNKNSFKKQKEENSNSNNYDNKFDDLSEDKYYDKFEPFCDPIQLLNWQEPTTKCSLEVLMNDTNIWRMSKTERATLHDFWQQEINARCVKELAKLQKIHDEKRKEVDNIYNEKRKKVLKECDVIGMTTNGVAKFQSLIRSISPRVILCEEAGEVLEAHILSALTPFTQHLILIGDHNQLRPHIATYNLSCESKTGENYRLNESLFERLVNNGDKAIRLDKSQLLTQRRMRACEISDSIRHTLYPSLIDGKRTNDYPNVRGAQHNVYFINHRYLEDKGKDEFAVQSHSNQYEVDMVIEMVNYFVRNGYTKKDDIAVLTPYLGQMMKLRDALNKTFTVVIDERDGQNLAEMEDETEENKLKIDNVTRIATKKSLNQQVTLRTVDNFQGEEANIVIISLVRNSSSKENRGSIGFLKSTNRSNVLLSRAKHGMYLLGNAELMANGSPTMWGKVIQMLKSRNPPQVGDSFPIVCPQHSNNKNNVKKPKQFIEFAPDGGCLERCGQKLKCGHSCPYKCHIDNPSHIDVFCRKYCTRLHPECSHPCNKLCGDKCGDCTFIIGNIKLPSCGHTYPKARCYETRDIESIHCRVKVFKKLPKCGHRIEVMCYKSVDQFLEDCTLIVGDIILPSCGHTYQKARCCETRNMNSIRCYVEVLKTLPKCGHKLKMKCYESVDNIICKEPCGELNKCGHICSAPCFECQKRSIEANYDEALLDENGYVKRDTHGPCRKVCEKNLFCGHKCEEVCHGGRNCSPCTARCTVSCSHSSCKLECNEPCTSCAEPCDWHCPHGKGSCLISCGAPCSRLPCNLRCEKKLECGHRCPGVCGEDCPTRKFCETCASDDVKGQMIDYIELKTFAEIDWGIERMIILECGHVFTMETMDGHMEMENYYEGDYEEWTGVKMLSSQTGENKIMTCPNCRAPIRSIKRYGRSIKKRILDTQNKKFLTKYDLHLKNRRNLLKAIMKKMENDRPKLLEDFKNDQIHRKYNKYNSNENENKNIASHLIPEVTTTDQFYEINSIPELHKILWNNHVRKLLNSYNQLTLIMAEIKNPPYKKAFEAAVAYLYNEKSKMQIDPLINNLEIMEDTESSENQKVRFEQSLREVGLIKPKFDQRVYLDSFLEIVNVQKVMFHEVTQIVPTLALAKRIIWIKFGRSISNSIKNHLEVICQTCKESKYGRHLVLASLEFVEFEYLVNRFTLNNPPTPDGILNDPIKKDIKNKCDKIRKDCDKIFSDILPKVELEHFQGQCVERINKLLNDVVKLQDTAERSGRLSQEEKLEIYRAISSEFIGSGHWYECPNGHPYTIGECGGAMETSRCPDCGATVGGGSHVLTTGNRRNVEFETMME